jgi:hypothetical protein
MRLGLPRERQGVGFALGIAPPLCHVQLGRRLGCGAGDEQGRRTTPLTAGLSPAGSVAERLVVAERVKPAGAGTTYFKPTERPAFASVVRRVPVVSATPYELAGLFFQRRQQMSLFGIADQFKAAVTSL